MSTKIDFDCPTPTVLSPTKLAHVVLRTNNFSTMTDFYKTFLGGTASYENDYASFITYDEEHHRIALLAFPGTSDKVTKSCGLEHIAFTYPSLSHLLLSYRQRKARGIHPRWCINHGPTTSLYYADPDGNTLETQVDNMDVEAVSMFMKSKLYDENPMGTEFEPEDLIKRFQAGESEESLLVRKEVGPRGLMEAVPEWMTGGEV